MAASDHLITLAFDVYIDSFEEVFEPRLNHKKIGKVKILSSFYHNLNRLLLKKELSFPVIFLIVRRKNIFFLWTLLSSWKDESNYIKITIIDGLLQLEIKI